MCIILHLVSDTCSGVHAYWSEGLKERNILCYLNSQHLEFSVISMLDLALFQCASFGVKKQQQYVPLSF